MTQTITEAPRISAYDIEPLVLNRWSPRAFDSRPVAEETLYSIFEAARWAPSSMNEQPWRYIIARTTEDRTRFQTFINDFNRVWSDRAPVLAAVISKNTFSNGSPNAWNAFDTGASWGYLALEAFRKGLVTHALGGFDAQLAKQVLGVPDGYEVHAIIAIGYQGDKSLLPGPYQERELPSGRRPINETVFEGSFQN